jgi:hypothetical protein
MDCLTGNNGAKQLKTSLQEETNDNNVFEQDL